MKTTKYLKIKGDTNDADYIMSFKEITELELEKYRPLLQAIANFKPYTVTRPGRPDWTHYGNFPNHEHVRNDLGEKSPEEIYPEFVELIDELLEDGYVPFGIHSIASIEVVEVANIEKIF